MPNLLLPRRIIKTASRIRHPIPKPPRRALTGASRRLSDIVDVKKLEAEQPDAIKNIWAKYHAGSRYNCGTTLSVAEYEKILRNARRARRFVFPAPFPVGNPPAGGFFVMYSEFQDSFCLMTSLEAFRDKGAGAGVYFIVSLFGELVDSRDIALVRGEVLNDCVDVATGKALMESVLELYLSDVEFNATALKFNQSPLEFDVKAYFRAKGFDLDKAVGV